MVLLNSWVFGVRIFRNLEDGLNLEGGDDVSLEARAPCRGDCLSPLFV